ncbi:MAG: class I SAM-dependent methyltransferase [Acidobacteria bacterium]|nr:class I SAM-dependent methyltransferase [Acidobacteriota bacterium]
MMAHMGSQVYDAIADSYRESKWLLFRHFIERYTLAALLGDLHGRTVLDMACGEGVYARQFRRAGAAGVTGVDISPAMVELAESQEREDPIGCRYVCADAAAFRPAAPFDVVTAIYLLNYASTAEQATSHDERTFEFDNYYLQPATYETAMRDAGFEDFRWVDAMLDPAEQDDPFWADFMAQAPLTAFCATRPESR